MLKAIRVLWIFCATSLMADPGLNNRVEVDEAGIQPAFFDLQSERVVNTRVVGQGGLYESQGWEESPLLQLIIDPVEMAPNEGTIGSVFLNGDDLDLGVGVIRWSSATGSPNYQFAAGVRNDSCRHSPDRHWPVWGVDGNGNITLFYGDEIDVSYDMEGNRLSTQDIDWDNFVEKGEGAGKGVSISVWAASQSWVSAHSPRLPFNMASVAPSTFELVVTDRYSIFLAVRIGDDGFAIGNEGCSRGSIISALDPGIYVSGRDAEAARPRNYLAPWDPLFPVAHSGERFATNCYTVILKPYVLRGCDGGRSCDFVHGGGSLGAVTRAVIPSSLAVKAVRLRLRLLSEAPSDWKAQKAYERRKSAIWMHEIIIRLERFNSRARGRLPELGILSPSPDSI